MFFKGQKRADFVRVVSNLFTQTTKPAGQDSVFVKGSTLETSLSFTSEQLSVGNSTLTGVSTQDFNLTQTATGELLFTEIVPSVSVTYTEITHSGDTWTEVTHTGDTWTDITP